MKRKAIESTPPAKTRKTGLIATVQQVDGILVLNIFKDKILKNRYCMNTSTYEHQEYNCTIQKWTGTKIYYLLNYTKLKFNSKKEEKMVLNSLHADQCKYAVTALDLIDVREGEYSTNRKSKAEQNRINRVNAVMSKVPEISEGIDQWIFEQETGSKDYAFFDEEIKKWTCTGCGRKFDGKFLRRVDGEKNIRHNDMVKCPRCKKIIQVKKRTRKQKTETNFALLQPIDDEISVARHFDVGIYWNLQGKQIEISESVRIILYKLNGNRKYACDLYYNQYGKNWGKTYERFDNKGNSANRRMLPGYLYETGIREALENTCYSAWIRLFEQMAAAGKKVDYNKLMMTQNNLTIIQMVEHLFKGRFDRLLLETSEKISTWTCNYHGPLKPDGQTIEEVFCIKDRQKINRIRDLNAGEKVLEWMRWSDVRDRKIPQEVLEWLLKNNIGRNDVKFIEDKMSIQKIMNYVKRQQAEGYQGKSAKAVLSQWDDYLRMCANQNKNMEDELVYRPRELKRRHNEIVDEIQKQQMIEEMKRNKKEKEAKAKQMRDRFPGAEENLAAVREKFEYENDRYKIIVPTKLVDIITEGHALHHCVASSDRYFDRIMQKETYVCFLRKQSEPDVPYYTIEIEPGGTIRQSRGYLDEEPDIEDVKPFLREWQKEIKKRLKAEDVRLAEISAQKRAANIEELKAKNNTRVLEGLLEDFMEAI